MAIRDGLLIEVEEERARERAREAAPRGKGRRKAAAAQEELPRQRQVSMVMAVLAVVFIFVVASAYAFFTLRQDHPGPKLVLEMAKAAYAPGEIVNITVRLENPSSGELQVYELSTTKKFSLQIVNESGSAVASTYGQGQNVPTRIEVGPGESEELGTFEWNQTVEAVEGGNVTYEQVPPGIYTIQASLEEHTELWVKKNVLIG